MKFTLIFFNQTPLFLAVEKNEIKTVKLLLKRKEIDVNSKSIIIVFILNIILYY